MRRITMIGLGSRIYSAAQTARKKLSSEGLAKRKQAEIAVAGV